MEALACQTVSSAVSRQRRGAYRQCGIGFKHVKHRPVVWGEWRRMEETGSMLKMLKYRSRWPEILDSCLGWGLTVSFRRACRFVSTKSFVVRLKVLAFACCLLCAQWLGDSFSVAKTSRYLFDHQIYAHSALCQVAQEAFDVSFTLELRNVSLKHLPSPVPRLNNCQNI